MYQTLTFYTFLALAVFFITVEIYRAKFFLKGYITEFCPSDLGIEEFILTRLKVQLRTGQIVEAEASRCTMCLGNLSVGDEVSVSRSHDRYVVNLPFQIKKNLGNRIGCNR